MRVGWPDARISCYGQNASGLPGMPLAWTQVVEMSHLTVRSWKIRSMDCLGEVQGLLAIWEIISRRTGFAQYTAMRWNGG